MNASFEMKCECCSKELGGKPYLLDKVTEKKLCLHCSRIKVNYSIESDDNKTLILGEDALLIGVNGREKRIDIKLLNLTTTETLRAQRNIAQGVNFITKRHSEKYSVDGIAQDYECIPQTASRDELDGAVLGAEIANLEFAIDKAIDAGDRYTFLALSGQLKELLAKVGEADEV